jgi:hypothetical protein
MLGSSRSEPDITAAMCGKVEVVDHATATAIPSLRGSLAALGGAPGVETIVHA